MTDSQNALAEVIVACWKDEALKARFMADPKAVLAEHGMKVPNAIAVEVNEDTDLHINLTIPKAPGAAAGLSDEELDAVAGGGNLFGDAGCCSDSWACSLF